MKIPIGKRIRKVRRELDLTQKQVAEMVGFSAQALSAIESGTTVEPDRSNLISLAQKLKNDFGEAWLTEYINGIGINPNKRIEEMPVEEIVSIKFPGKSSHRTKAEMKRMRDYLDSKLNEMSDEE